MSSQYKRNVLSKNCVELFLLNREIFKKKNLIYKKYEKYSHSKNILLNMSIVNSTIIKREIVVSHIKLEERNRERTF